MTTIGQINRIEECVIEWLIKDFFSLSDEEEEFYNSPMFVFHNLSWFLKIYPNGYKHSHSKEYISLYLFRESAGPPITIEFNLGVKTIDDKLDPNGPVVSHLFEEKFHYGIHTLLSRTKVLKSKYRFTASDTLIFVCNLKTSKIFSNEISRFQESKILQDYKELFLTQKNCDIIIKVKDQEIPAHRIILSARSPIFKSAFRIKGRGKKKRTPRIINVKDFEPSIFSDFLCFLYCGDAEIITGGNVFSLFTAAEKYDVSDLCETCFDFMKENISIDTFCDTIIWALEHSETELITLTRDFFTMNYHKIVKTSKWKSFLTSNPTECNELLIKAFDSFKDVKKKIIITPQFRKKTYSN